MSQKDYIEVSLFDISDTFPDENTSPFPQSMIDEELRKGSGFENGKYRIYKWFNENHTEQQNEKFLAREYGLGGWTTTFGTLDHSSKGLEFRKYKYSEGYKPEIIKIMSWREVSERIQVLIALNKYLNEKESKHYELIKNKIDFWYFEDIIQTKSNKQKIR